MNAADGWLLVLLNAGVAVDNHDLHIQHLASICGSRQT